MESDGDQVRVGAAVGGADVLGYHGYGATATWLVARPAESTAPTMNSPDWSVSYTYGRWRPVPWVAAESKTSFFVGPGAGFLHA